MKRLVNNGSIWTDCEVAMKRLNGAGLGSLAQVLSGWKKNPKTCFKKVKAHPERRLPLSSWSVEEKGNFMADQVAGGILPPDFTIHASEWLSRIGAAHSKLVIGRTVWEFEKLLPAWVDAINTSIVDIVSVPTEWNKQCFIFFNTMYVCVVLSNLS